MFVSVGKTLCTTSEFGRWNTLKGIWLGSLEDCSCYLSQICRTYLELFDNKNSSTILDLDFSSGLKGNSGLTEHSSPHTHLFNGTEVTYDFYYHPYLFCPIT